jgi:hypothetical protein
MPVHYHISPALNMILFICEGSVTGPELFHASELAKGDRRFQYGMFIAIDLFSAKDRFELADIQLAVARMNETAEKGFERGKILLLSASTGVHLLVDMINLLPSEVDIKLRAFQSLDEAIDSWGLSASKDQVIQFWNESHSSADF